MRYNYIRELFATIEILPIDEIIEVVDLFDEMHMKDTRLIFTHIVAAGLREVF